MRATFLLIFILLGGCSSKFDHNFHTLSPQVRALGTGKVIVSTTDIRPAVLIGDRTPQYIGTVREIDGDTIAMQTGSGMPLAEDISASTCRSLFERGYDCVPLVSKQRDTSEEIRYLLNTHSPVRLLFFSLAEWESDSLYQTSIRYDISLEIWARNGDKLTSVNVKGSDKLDVVSYLNPVKNSSIVVPQAMEELLGLLLQSKQVTRALSLVKPIDPLGARY